MTVSRSNQSRGSGEGVLVEDPGVMNADSSRFGVEASRIGRLSSDEIPELQTTARAADFGAEQSHNPLPQLSSPLSFQQDSPSESEVSDCPLSDVGGASSDGLDASDIDLLDATLLARPERDVAGLVPSVIECISASPSAIRALRGPSLSLSSIDLGVASDSVARAGPDAKALLLNSSERSGPDASALDMTVSLFDCTPDAEGASLTSPVLQSISDCDDAGGLAATHATDIDADSARQDDIPTKDISRIQGQVIAMDDMQMDTSLDTSAELSTVGETELQALESELFDSVPMTSESPDLDSPDLELSHLELSDSGVADSGLSDLLDSELFESPPSEVHEFQGGEIAEEPVAFQETELAAPEPEYGPAVVKEYCAGDDEGLSKPEWMNFQPSLLSEEELAVIYSESLEAMDDLLPDALEDDIVEDAVSAGSEWQLELTDAVAESAAFDAGVDSAVSQTVASGVADINSLNAVSDDCDPLFSQPSFDDIDELMGGAFQSPAPNRQKEMRSEMHGLRGQIDILELREEKLHLQLTNFVEEIDQLNEQNVLLEKLVQELPDLYRQKFHERMQPIKERIARIQEENLRLHADIDWLTQKLAANVLPPAPEDRRLIKLPSFGRRLPMLPGAVGQ